MSGEIVCFADRQAAQAKRFKPELPKDTSGKRPTRLRWMAFQKAEIYLNYLKDLRSAAWTAATLYKKHGVAECAPYADLDDRELWEKIQRAIVALLLTPAANVTQLQTKRRLLAKGIRWLADGCVVFDHAIAQDEVYLATPRKHRNAVLMGQALTAEIVALPQGVTA